jgi:ABC-type phosphate transport system substrate-binding protein
MEMKSLFVMLTVGSAMLLTVGCGGGNNTQQQAAADEEPK